MSLPVDRRSGPGRATSSAPAFSLALDEWAQPLPQQIRRLATRAWLVIAGRFPDAAQREAVRR
jgi:hypothetical protein